MSKYLSYIFLSTLLIVFTLNHLQFTFSDQRGYIDIHEVGYLYDINTVDENIISAKNFDLTKIFMALSLKIFPKTYQSLRIIMLLLFFFFLRIYYKYLGTITSSIYIPQLAIFFLLSMPGILLYTRIIWPQMYSASFLLLGIMNMNKRALFCKKNIIALGCFVIASCFHYSAFFYIFIILIYCKMFTEDKIFKAIMLFASILIVSTIAVLLTTNYNHTTFNVFRYLLYNINNKELINTDNIYNSYEIFFLNQYQMYLFLTLAFISFGIYIYRKHKNSPFLIFFGATYILLVSQPVDAKIFCFIITLALILKTFAAIPHKTVCVALYIGLGLISFIVNITPLLMDLHLYDTRKQSKLYGLKLEKRKIFGIEEFSDFLKTLKYDKTNIGLLKLDYYLPNTGILSELDIYLLKPKDSNITAKHISFHDTTFNLKDYPVKVGRDNVDFDKLHYFILDKFHNNNKQSPLIDDVLQIMINSNKMILYKEINLEHKKTYIFKNAKTI